MTDATETAKSKAPTHLVYQIRAYKNGGEARSNWTKIGVAWAHKKGQGFNIQLDAFPVDGRLTVYPMADKKAENDPVTDGETE